MPHRTEFDAQAVKQQLGIAIRPWSAFESYLLELAQCRVTDRMADRFLAKVLASPTSATSSAAGVNERASHTVRTLFAGQGMGAGLVAAKGTAWGLLNSVTEYVDHHRRARSEDYRRDGAWFGQGAMLKQKAWSEAMRLVA